ncbi:MAG: HAD-IIA family hydrolase [Anaerolineae bacterium]
MNLSSITAVIMDMDGVLWEGDHALPGLVPLFDFLRERKLKFALATNNATRNPAEYIAKFERLGVQGVRADQIVTSGMVTARYLQSSYPAGTAVHVLGSDGLRNILTAAGFLLTDEKVEAVVAGLDMHLTYEKLKRASLLIQNGAAFIATNEDPSLPSPEGLIPGAGSVIAALQTACGKTPFVMGKPHKPMYDIALEILDAPPNETLMIGDRLDTDIAGAIALGIPTTLVLTGASSREDVENGSIKPDSIFAGLPELLAAWE